MYSLTVKPLFAPIFPAASSSSCRWPRLCSSIGFRVKTESRGRRFGLRIHAYDSSKSDTPNANGDSKPPNGTLVVVIVSAYLNLLIISFLDILYVFSLFPKPTAEEQERNSIGVCKKCATRIHGVVCEKSSPAGISFAFWPLIPS